MIRTIRQAWARCVARRPSLAARRARLTVEPLEGRLTPSVDGLPAITGPSHTPEGGLYTLQLDPGTQALVSWTIDWGDGTEETLPGSATSAEHRYLDGGADRVITARAQAASSLAAFFWSPDVGGNGHYYAVTTGGPTSWTAAEAEAVALGGHLVSITSAAEQNFIVATFLSGANQNRIYWIGLNDTAVEGQFAWSSGEAVSYTNWQRGEPNNFRGAEDYCAINWHYTMGHPGAVRGAWNDAPLNGSNTNGSAPFPTPGLMEFAELPPGDTTVRTLAVQVENVAPTVGIEAADGPVLRGQEQVFTLTAADPSPIDQAADFTFAIDWDGDGQADEEVRGPSGLTVRHTFTEKGKPAVGVTAADRDGGASSPVARDVDVEAVVLLPDPLRPDGQRLVIAGTPGDDTIVVRSLHRTGEVRVTINGVVEGTYPAAPVVELLGYGGNDRLNARGFRGESRLFGGSGNDLLIAARGPSLLLGGAGNDILIGGGKADVLSGGAGNDLLLGGGDRDVLIGGDGTDWLRGGSGADRRVAGALAEEEDVAALDQMRTDWLAQQPKRGTERSFLCGEAIAWLLAAGCNADDLT